MQMQQYSKTIASSPLQEFPRGMDQQMTNVLPMYTCTALWKLCSISSLLQSRCWVILPSCMTHHVWSPGIVLLFHWVSKNHLRWNQAILTRSDLKSVSSCAQIQTLWGENKHWNRRLKKDVTLLQRSDTCILMKVWCAHDHSIRNESLTGSSCASKWIRLWCIYLVVFFYCHAWLHYGGPIHCC